MKARHQGSILMILLWIVAIFALFTLGLGYRAALNLRLSRYQRDGLRAEYLARAGIIKAREILNHDNKVYDYLGEKWSTGKDDTGEDLYKNVISEFGDGSLQVKIYDEQGRININVTGLKQLELLFGGKIADASGAAKIVNAWKSSGGQLLPGPEQTDEDAYFKNAPFRVTEELMFALSYLYKDDPEAARAKVFEDYSRLKDLITVFPQQAAKPVININTAGKDALTLTGVFTGANSNDAASLVEKIIQYRDDSAKYFTQTSNINDILSSASVVLTDQEQGVLNKIKDLLIVKSSMFRIQSNAEVRGVRKSITAVYDRDSKKIVYWRQN